jgi:hypothetical protein
VVTNGSDVGTRVEMKVSMVSVPSPVVVIGQDAQKV